MRYEKYKHVYSLKIIYNKNILDSGTFLTEKEALEFAKFRLREICYNDIYGTLDKIEDNDEIPETITETQFERWVQMKQTNDNEFTFSVDVISLERRSFNTSDELNKFFTENINSVSNEALYDFLLSFVESEHNWYDYTGKLFNHHIFERMPLNENISSTEFDFNEKECKKGRYTFKFK